MTGVYEVHRNPGHRGEGLVVVDRVILLNCSSRIHLGVKRFHGWFSAAVAFLVDIFRIGFLDVRGIQQHDLAQRGGWRGGVDRSGETALDQVGQVAAVIDVRV